MGYTSTWSLRRPTEPVHPHIRGVYVSFSLATSTLSGSSPHTWGIPSCYAKLCSGNRFIPTYVGYTWMRVSRMPPGTVHPHIRGVYKSSLGNREAVFGSSPHTWGIRGVTMRTVRRWRFIPTYVGYTGGDHAHSKTLAVHPHTRGAYTGSSRNVNSKIGSSPHTWGIQHAVGRRAVLERFIPTYVGHAYNRTRLYIFNPVHPHIRGAYGSVHS